MDRTLRKLVRDVKPIGIISPEIVYCKIFGFMAVVYTIETVEQNPLTRGNKRNGRRGGHPYNRPTTSTMITDDSIVKKVEELLFLSYSLFSSVQ